VHSGKLLIDQSFSPLKPSNPINFLTPSVIGATDIVVDDTATFQTVWVFGGSLSTASLLFLPILLMFTDLNRLSCPNPEQVEGKIILFSFIPTLLTLADSYFISPIFQNVHRLRLVVRYQGTIFITYSYDGQSCLRSGKRIICKKVLY